jgi:pimeloyl-ACP methyl ester carboxylesterase
MSAPSEGFSAHRAVRVGPVTTHVAEAGEGVPVLMLHGNPDTHTVWAGLASRLTRRGALRCIAPDLPGFGASAAPDDLDCSLAAQSRHVAGLLDALSLERVHLVVHDIGGMYGLAFASEHPERLHTLTIFNTSFHPDLRWHFWARMWRTPLVGEVVMALGTETLFVRETRKGSPGLTAEHTKAMWAAFTPQAKRMVLRFYRKMDPEGFHGWNERLRQTTARVPTRVLWGDLDPFSAPSMADRFGGEVEHHADAGHWPMIDKPDEVAAAVAAHLGERPPEA